MGRPEGLDPLLGAMNARYGIEITSFTEDTNQYRLMLRLSNTRGNESAHTNFERGVGEVILHCIRNGIAADFSRMYYWRQRKGTAPKDVKDCSPEELEFVYGYRLYLGKRVAHCVQALRDCVRRAPLKNRSRAPSNSLDYISIDSRFANDPASNRGRGARPGGMPVEIQIQAAQRRTT